MIIAVNTQLMIYGKLDGIGWFTYETLKRITHNHPEHQFIFIFDRKPSPQLSFPDNVKFIVLPPMARHPLLWFIRFEMLMPLVLKKYKADIFVSPDGWMTLGTKVPCLQVIHDLNFIHHPGDTPFFPRKYYNILFPRYARIAKRIVTVSEYSKSDIVKTLGISASKVDVAYNGCNTIYTANHSEDEKQLIRNEFSDGKPFFLYVGALIPRKNIARMFKAFDSFKKQDSKGTKLLVVGQKKWWTDEINQAWETMNHKSDVVFLGRMDAEKLTRLYAASRALVFVPYFEGFGIPIIEAFNSGTAVITSNITSMPEVAGDAALLVDPFSVVDISDAMTTISENDNLRKELVEKSLVRARQFSWHKTADQLWKSIERVMDEK